MAELLPDQSELARAYGRQSEAIAPTPAATMLARLVDGWYGRLDRSRLDQPMRDLFAEARDLINGGR